MQLTILNWIAIFMFAISMCAVAAVVNHILTSNPDYDDEIAEYVEFLNSGILELI